MANGEIEEHGTHNKFLNENGLHHKLWETQSIGQDKLITNILDE